MKQRAAAVRCERAKEVVRAGMANNAARWRRAAAIAVLKSTLMKQGDVPHRVRLMLDILKKY